MLGVIARLNQAAAAAQLAPPARRSKIIVRPSHHHGSITRIDSVDNPDLVSSSTIPPILAIAQNGVSHLPNAQAHDRDPSAQRFHPTSQTRIPHAPSPPPLHIHPARHPLRWQFFHATHYLSVTLAPLNQRQQKQHPVAALHGLFTECRRG